MTNRIKSILVANRGEIALRVMRSARAMGCRTVAVYSDADANAPHARFADQAVRIGPPPLAESYLAIDRILDAARSRGADAIHPGYGFLSENAAFARAVEAAGLVFIGPTPEAIEAMGDKAAAKRRMHAAGVPCVPGYEGEDQADSVFQREAARIGYPVMIKAAAGGGGRGMRLVHGPGDLVPALAMARSEARNAFGSDALILERAIVRARHVEIQVFADTHGSVIHLGERDCSVQRRHQKVIEEAPCPVMTPELRARMGGAAIEAARSIAYRGAGTVEFLLDERGEFYFLEMNTRLQVEHPVTELVTGLDLVALQIRVAEGHALGIRQDEVALHGHAIEVRLYAEDPARGFLPASGRIALFEPARGEGLRCDAGIESGQDVSPFYDPLLAKLIAWGEDREQARRRLVDSLERTRVLGLATNRGFLIELLEREGFGAGRATTAFIGEEFGGAIAPDTATADEAAIAAVLQFRAARDRAAASSLGFAHELLDWSSHGRAVTAFRYALGDAQAVDLQVAANSGQYRVRGAGREWRIRIERESAHGVVLALDGMRHDVGFVHGSDGTIQLALGRRTLTLHDALASAALVEEAGGGGRVSAPMHGVIIEVSVEAGQQVRRGMRLAVLEAMKMQHELLAGADGKVVAVPAKKGMQVAAGDLLVEIEPGEQA